MQEKFFWKTLVDPDQTDPIGTTCISKRNVKLSEWLFASELNRSSIKYNPFSHMNMNLQRFYNTVSYSNWMMLLYPHF